MGGRSRRVTVPQEIVDAAGAVRELLTTHKSLRFPEAFVQAHDGHLQSITGYSGDAWNWREPEWGPDLRKAGFREISKVIVKALTGGSASFVTSDFPTPRSNIVEMAGLAALHPHGAAPPRPKMSEEDRGGIGRQVLIYEAVCAVNYGCSMRSLQADIGAGKEKSLLKLVQLDKSTVTLPFVQGWIKRAQHRADWGFFERLGAAIKKPPLEAPRGMYAALVLIGGFWDEYFRLLTYPDTIKLLERFRFRGCKSMQARALSEALRRRGLTKQVHRTS